MPPSHIRVLVALAALAVGALGAAAAQRDEPALPAGAHAVETRRARGGVPAPGPVAAAPRTPARGAAVRDAQQDPGLMPRGLYCPIERQAASRCGESSDGGVSLGR